MQSKIDDTYNLPNGTTRTDLINTANMIQDISFNMNEVNSISKTINLDDYNSVINKLKNSFKTTLSEIKTISDETNKLGNTNLLENIDVNNTQNVKEIKKHVELTNKKSKELHDLTKKMGNIIQFINNEIE